MRLIADVLTLSLKMSSNLNLVSATLQDVVDALDSGNTTSEELVNRYIGKPSSDCYPILAEGTVPGAIEENNTKGKEPRAVIQVAPLNKCIFFFLHLSKCHSSCSMNAVMIDAKWLDEERDHGKIRSQLHGVPILVK